jgi:hypothetical protein
MAGIVPIQGPPSWEQRAAGMTMDQILTDLDYSDPEQLSVVISRVESIHTTTAESRYLKMALAQLLRIRLDEIQAGEAVRGSAQG